MELRSLWSKHAKIINKTRLPEANVLHNMMSLEFNNSGLTNIFLNENKMIF